MKRRSMVTAVELDALLGRVDRALETQRLETQPRVAVRIIGLVQNPDAQLKDYGEVIKADVTLTGRLLRLANSAYFAQRSPITKLERALVLLGIERVRAISLGFYLTRSAQAPGAREIARQVWGQSVFRGCLAAALTREKNPDLASEAFVVGLMMDCGIPLMSLLLGPAYDAMYTRARTPADLYQTEFETLEFTHVDVATVMARRWRLPPLLAKPITWHHSTPSSQVQPPARTSLEPAARLLRVAQYVGAVALTTEGIPTQGVPEPELGNTALGMESAQLSGAVSAAAREYGAISLMFSDVAAPVPDIDGLCDSVTHQLVDELDKRLAREIADETRGRPGSVVVAGLGVEITVQPSGRIRLCLHSEGGDPICSCEVPASETNPMSLRRAIGIDEATDEELRTLAAEIKAMAA